MRPVLFSLGPLTFHGYGALIVLGGVLAFSWLWRRREKAGLSVDAFWRLVNAILIGGFAGGRLLYLLEYSSAASFWRDLLSPSSGFSVLGAFGGVTAGVWWVSRRDGVPFLRLMDHVCWMAPFWHAFGRLGCLLAGCCHGRPTDLPWGVTFTDPLAMVPRRWLGVPLHPAQLYEAAGDALLAAALYRLLDKRPGTVMGAYFLSYGVLRFVLEYWRGDTVPFALGLTAGQALALALVAAGGALLCTRRS